MTYTQKQKDKILKLRRDYNMGSDAIARKLKLSRNSVRDFLRKHGFLRYSYPHHLRTGSPSSLDSPSWSELEKKGILLKNALEQIQTLEQQVNESNQKLNKKNDEYNKLKQEHAISIQERDGYKQQRSENEKELQEEKRQKDELNRQINEELPRLRQDNENLTSKNTKFIEESHKKENKIEELENALKKVQKPPVTPHTSPGPQIQSTTDSSHADEETENPSGGVDWSLVALGGVGAFIQVTTSIYKSKTTNLQAAGSWKNMKRVIPMVMVCSGISYSGSENTGNTFPNPGIVLQPNQGMNSGMIPVSNDILCSGFYSGMSGENSSVGYVVSNQDDVNQPDNQNSVTIDSNSLDPQGSKNYCSGHIGPLRFIQQYTTRSSSFQTPFNYYYIPLPSPLPDDLSEVYPMRRLLGLGGIQFEEFLEDLIKHMGCPVERTKQTRDKGVDLIATLDGKKTVIQAKQQPVVGISAVQQIIAAKIDQKAKRAIVITTGRFTKDALDLAKNIGVKCWDGAQLLQEIYKYQFFILPK
jgi:hypothetical protein